MDIQRALHASRQATVLPCWWWYDSVVGTHTCTAPRKWPKAATVGTNPMEWYHPWHLMDVGMD